MKYFYTELIDLEEIYVKLDELDLSDDQKNHLASLIDSTIHQEVLDLILSQLPSEDKQAFLAELSQHPEDQKLLEFINRKVEKIEEQITQTVKKIKTELHEDIEEAKKQ